MAKRKSASPPVVNAERTFRQIFDAPSSWSIPLDDGIAWPGKGAEDEATVLRKQVTAYRFILMSGFTATDSLITSLMVRPVIGKSKRTPWPRDRRDLPETQHRSSGLRVLLRQYREGEDINQDPEDVAIELAEILAAQESLRSLRSLVDPRPDASRQPEYETVPLAQWPCEQVVTLGRCVEYSWALAIQTMMREVADAVLPRPDLMDAPPTVKWMVGAAENIREVIPPYDQWELRHLHPRGIVPRHLRIECEKWLIARINTSASEECSLPMSREDVARRFFGNPEARFRKIKASAELMRRVRPVPGKPKLVQFDLRGLAAEIRARLTVERWPSDSS